MQRIQFLAHGQMRQIRKRRENAGVRRNLADKRLLARAGLFPTEPIRGRSRRYRRPAQEKLGLRCTRRLREGEVSVESRTGIDVHRSIASDAFRERDPKQWEKGSRVMKVNRPLRRTPGEKVLEKNRRSDQQPAWPHERAGPEREGAAPKAGFHAREIGRALPRSAAVA